MERRGDNGHAPGSSDLREMAVLLRVLEYRQGELESGLAKVFEQVNGKEGLAHQHLKLQEETRHRHTALMCALKYIGGFAGSLVLAVILALIFWKGNEDMATRDAVKQLLTRPGVPGPQTPGK